MFEDEFISALAKRVAEELQLCTVIKKPLTPAEFSEALGGKLSASSIRRHVQANRIRKIEGLGDKILIPFTELERFTQ